MKIPSTPGLVNSKYILQCFATGSPKPAITWIKDEREFDPENFEEILKNGTYNGTYNEQILIIPKLTLNHTGKYGCIAENEAGTDEATKFIEVGAIPQFIKKK
ncbi:Vascular endothelial growth factor receptor 3, partial [Gryllus bimaculatus]